VNLCYTKFKYLWDSRKL